MLTYDNEQFDKWAYVLDRVYTGYCHDFVQQVISA